jgi:tryptophan synthase alpha chain
MKTQTELAPGVGRIARVFERTRKMGRAALMPYFTLGYPDAETSVDIIQAIAQSGADLIELGVPFSDPLADGPTIQRSAQLALQQGMTVRRSLELTANLRERGIAQPFLLMGYINPILTYGVERFVNDAASSGADGLIVPDLPPEEASELEGACRKAGLALVYLVAPTSTDERIQLVAERSSGFIYLVSVTGVTGARTVLADNLMPFIQRVRDLTEMPLAVGFGISTPEQAAYVGGMADGVIVGSALINVAGSSNDPARSAADFVAMLRDNLGKD